jgi:hypothetical protein
MVRMILAAALMLAPNLRSDVGAVLARPTQPPGLSADPSPGLGRASAAPTTATATPAVDAGPGFEKNHPVEDFFTVTLVSLPFTALWALIGASVVGGISQGKYPPEFNSDMLIGAGAVAVGASLGIGIVSVAWGKGRGKASNSTPLKQGN